MLKSLLTLCACVALTTAANGTPDVSLNEPTSSLSSSSSSSSLSSRIQRLRQHPNNVNPSNPIKQRLEQQRKGITNGDTPLGILIFTRFNCAFPLCPTTALDVCAADEHFEWGRPVVLATLIEQTTTADMNFYAYSDFDNSTRLHYTLAARLIDNQPVNQLFTVSVSFNGTGGNLLSTVEVTFPSSLTQSMITYLFTYKNLVYIAFTDGTLLTVQPTSGTVVNTTSLFPPNSGYVDYLAAAFDPLSGAYYANAQNTNMQFFLHTYNIDTQNSTMVGPMPPAPGTAGPNNERVDSAVGTVVTYSPHAPTGPMSLLELRTSNDAPYLFMAWLDPLTGKSVQLPLPEDFYDNWDIDPNYFPDQWPGDKRRVWSWDPQNGWFFAKMYDECGGQDDSCDENEAIIYLQYDGTEAYWYTAVEPVEPQLTQMIWAWTNIVN